MDDPYARQVLNSLDLVRKPQVFPDDTTCKMLTGHGGDIYGSRLSAMPIAHPEWIARSATCDVCHSDVDSIRALVINGRTYFLCEESTCFDYAFKWSEALPERVWSPDLYPMCRGICCHCGLHESKYKGSSGGISRFYAIENTEAIRCQRNDPIMELNRLGQENSRTFPTRIANSLDQVQHSIRHSRCGAFGASSTPNMM